MAFPATQMMRPTPYAIPPRFHHPINRPAYGYNPHLTPTTHPTHPGASAFLSATCTSQVLAPNVTLGTCALPISTGNCHIPSPNSALNPSQVPNGLPTPPGLSESQRRQSSSSATSPIQSSSPGPLGAPPEEALSEAASPQLFKPCPYPLMPGGGGAGRGLVQPLPSCAHGTTLLPTHPHPSAAAVVPSPAGTAMYAAAPAQDYGPTGMNINLPTAAGTACLPTAMPLWNPYPPLSVPNGMMNPLSAGSIPKLSYDTPRYKLTPERAIPLIKWFEEHKDHPYPTRHEKMLLCQSTQLTFTQVSTWFANARRRMKKASSENGDDDKACSSDESSSPKDADSPIPSCDDY